MSIFGVSPEKDAELRRRMEACDLREEDLDEQFVRASGPGGQKVNRTATCVQLTHRPTGLSVKMQQERSQGLNRFFARRRLCELVEEQVLGKLSPKALRREKIRKQKKRRGQRHVARQSVPDEQAAPDL